MNQKQLAAALGVSPRAVRDALKDGRLSPPGADGFDLERAQREWAARTCPGRSRVPAPPPRSLLREELIELLQLLTIYATHNVHFAALMADWEHLRTLPADRLPAEVGNLMAQSVIDSFPDEYGRFLDAFAAD